MRQRQRQLFAQSQAQSCSNATSRAGGQGQTSESARLQALEQQLGAVLPMVAQHDEQLGSISAGGGGGEASGESREALFLQVAEGGEGRGPALSAF